MRWTIYVCEDCEQLAHGPGDRCLADKRRTWTKMKQVDVVSASFTDEDVERVAEALWRLNHPTASKPWVAVGHKTRAVYIDAAHCALSAYLSGD